jgi:hypothetical protein
MATLAQLVERSDQLLAAVKSLCALDPGDAEFMIQNPDADTEIKQVKATIFANAEAIKTLIQVPTDFLQQLASQVRFCFLCFPPPTPPRPRPVVMLDKPVGYSVSWSYTNWRKRSRSFRASTG